jgi:hypothetical protein
MQVILYVLGILVVIQAFIIQDRQTIIFRLEKRNADLLKQIETLKKKK